MTVVNQLVTTSEADFKGNRLNTLFGAANTGYVVIDKKGNVVDANPEYVRITGHARLDEILGRCVIEWTAPYEFEKNAAALKRCLEQGFIRALVMDYIHKDKTIATLEFDAMVFGDRKIFSLCRDISGRKEIERMSATTLASEDKLVPHPMQEAINERESLLAALDNVNFFVVIEDANYNIQYENKILREAFGGHVGTKCYQSYIGADRPCDICPVQEILHNDKKQFVYETTAGGRYFESNASRFQNADGSFSIIEALIDVTERKQLVDEILANQRLRESEQQLRAANQQLAAKEQALRASRNELTTKVAELERINKLMLGRELDMVKMKKQINSLLEEMERPKKYET
jgi:PAS domain S-box-containing protein